jgi:transcriptional regulator with XRE-family HTH domain
MGRFERLDSKLLRGAPLKPGHGRMASFCLSYQVWQRQPLVTAESSILDSVAQLVLYTGPMNLSSIGYLIARRRRAKRLTLAALASSAGVGRSPLAALESGKLPELGFVKLARLCDVVGLVLEARPLERDSPLMPHRHLTEAAGRDLTKAAIEDVIVRGDIAAWRGPVRAIRAGQQGGPRQSRTAGS